MDQQSTETRWAKRQQRENRWNKLYNKFLLTLLPEQILGKAQQHV